MPVGDKEVHICGEIQCLVVPFVPQSWRLFQVCDPLRATALPLASRKYRGFVAEVVSGPEIPVVDPEICVKFAHPAPWQRSTRYPVTPTLSVDAPQLRLIWLALAAVAVSAPGAVGGCVSEPAGVVALAMGEYPLKLFAASTARAR